MSKIVNEINSIIEEEEIEDLFRCYETKNERFVISFIGSD